MRRVAPRKILLLFILSFSFRVTSGCKEIDIMLIFSDSEEWNIQDSSKKQYADHSGEDGQAEPGEISVKTARIKDLVGFWYDCETVI
tara:strand:- start:12 stop:272 length:261 start_codon:yes stop_codon:yes gene_type:complete